MSWTTVIWSMVAGICLTMAGVHLLVWLQNRHSRTSLAFALSAIGAAATVYFELAMMHSQTTEQYGRALQLLHVPVFVLVASFVWFVGAYLQAGRAWLLWSFLAVRALILVIDLVSVPNGLYEITALRFFSIGGDTFAVPSGMTNPWSYLIRLSEVLLLLFIGDASYAAWKKGKRRQALNAGAVFFVAAAIGATLSFMMLKGTLRFPLTVSMPFLLGTLVMGVDMSVDLVHVQKISRKLSESQERMRMAISAANLNPWEYDLARDEIWTNEKGIQRMRAGGSAQLTADGFFESVHPEDRETARNAGLRAIEEGGDFQVEYRTIDPSGETRWIRAFGQVERDARGTPLRIRGVSMDFTERKHYESELEFIKKTIDVSPDGAYWMDAAGRFVYVNDVGCASLGYSRDELLQMDIFDIAPLASAEGWQEVWKFLRDKGEYATETIHRRKDGSEFPAEITSTYVVIDGHEYVSGFARDITERKLQTNALRESMERYRAMVESFDGFIYICSSANRIEFMNQRMIERTGRDAVGEPCYRALHEKDAVCEWCVNDRVFQGETVHWEIQSPKDQRWYYVVNTPIRHADGTISKQAMIQDITERKKAESESSQLRLELAHLNRVMTMSELSSSLAHEINQPLGAILNNASTVKILHSKCKGGQGEVAEILDDIIRDTNRAGQIVRRIRGIIKKEAGRFEPLDVNSLIREVVDLFGNPIEREKIIVRDNLSLNLPPVKGDRVGLQQVIMNLIMNATDVMKGSSSRILTIRTVMDGLATVLVSVSDTGPGISEMMKDRLFAPFTTTKKDGLGMGLRICRSIIDEHGGRIWAENNPEGGASFSFSLKADRCEAA